MNDSFDSELNDAPAPFGSAADGLEFPDWSGMVKHPSRVPLDTWLAYCRSNLPCLRNAPGYQVLRRMDGIPVEFVL